MLYFGGLFLDGVAQYSIVWKPDTIVLSDTVVTEDTAHSG